MKKRKTKNVKREQGFEFINNIKGGVIPQEFIPAVEKGLEKECHAVLLRDILSTDVSV